MAETEFIFLASASPRRAELLRQLGLRFEVIVAEVDETPQAAEDPLAYTLRVACEKVAAAVRRLGQPRAPVLAADTTVVVDGRILGKPANRVEGMGMLAQLSGRAHQVLSSVAVQADGRLHTALSTSLVTFGPITPAQASAYWETGEPADKAGGYAIQGLGALFVERLEGSYSGVMGLPLYETARLLQLAGMKIL